MENTTEATAAKPTPGLRYPLARDSQGAPFDVPPTAVAWRVRRGGGKRGRPRNVFDTDGRPLDVALGAALEDLVNECCTPGRYQLYPVDAEGRIVPGHIAVTEIPEEEEDTEARTAEDNVAIVGQMLTTIRAQSETLCRALEATTSGYGPVRPAVPASPAAPTHIVVEAPSKPAPPDAQAMNAQSIMKMVMEAIQMFAPLVSAMGGMGAGGASAPIPGADAAPIADAP